MGKKSRKKQPRKSNTSHPSSTDPENVVHGIRNMYSQQRQEMVSQSFAAMAQLDRYNLQEQKAVIRTALENMGTDVQMNDADQFGDGDQSPIETSKGRDAARELYSIGGDIHKHAVEDAMSMFGKLCLFGSAAAIQRMLDEKRDKLAQPYSTKEEMKVMLETRDTSLRLTPLLLLVSAGKNLAGGGGGIPSAMIDHVGVAKVLLKYGARPDAKDVLGKTVCHYGAGAMATPTTMQIVDLCIRAAKSSYLYGREVELVDLKKADMNGLKGVAGGFDPDSERRVVYLLQSEKEVSVKPINLRLVNDHDLEPPGKIRPITMLADVQDRLGSVSLHEVLMQDRADVAELLLNKHKTSIRTKDADGVSPLSMCTNGYMMSDSKVCHMIMAVTRQEGNKNRVEKKQATRRSCANCQMDLGKSGGQKCISCKIVIYCGRECQILHWKTGGHKAECTKLKVQSAGVTLRCPQTNGMKFASLSVTSGAKYDEGSYRIPRGVKPEERFVVKVQGGSDMMPILVYDETRTCEFNLDPGEPGFTEVLTEMRKEMAWNGRKTFMKASFDDKGNCTIFPLTAGVKAKYTW